MKLFSFLQIDSYGLNYTRPVPEYLRKKDNLARYHSLELLRSKATVDLALSLVDNIASGKDVRKMQAHAVVAQGLLEFAVNKLNAEASSSLRKAVEVRKNCSGEAVKFIESQEVVVHDTLRNGKLSENLFSDSAKEIIEKAIFCQAPRLIAQKTTKEYPPHHKSRSGSDQYMKRYYSCVGNNSD